MAPNLRPVFELTPVNAAVTFANGDGTGLKSIYTAGTEGGRIDAILISSDDTSAVNLAFHIYDGATSWYIGNVNVPIGSGYTTVAKVDGLVSLKPAYLNFLQLKGGYILKANAVVAVTAAKLVTVMVIGGDF